MPNIKLIKNFIQTNSPDGGFLQSVEWGKFQESFSRKTFNIDGENCWANIIEHELPVVGKYFYIPRGPIISISNQIPNADDQIKKSILSLKDLAGKNNIGWIRFDANDSNILKILSKNFRVKKAPHDMQPKEIFVIDITKSEEALLAEMKSKTRYNIKLSQKNKVTIFEIHNLDSTAQNKYVEKFIELVKITAKRNKITPHADEYYRKMFKTIPEENLKLYLAEYDDKVIAANVVAFYGKVATYLHGASDNEYRSIMAPYLLQWQAILDAKTAGCEAYDMGGIKTEGSGSWAGITRFKTGFSTMTKPLEFPGSYDIVLNPFKYNLYKILQRIRASF